MQSRDAAHPLGEHSMLEFSASSGHPHTLLHLLSFLGGSVRFYISSGCFTLLLLLKMLIFRVWSNQGWLLGVLEQRAGSSAGDNLAPPFKNPASFPEILQILVNQYFIKPRAASPGESCEESLGGLESAALAPTPSHPASPTHGHCARQGQMGPGTAFHCPECRRSVSARLFLMEDKSQSPWWFFIPAFCSFPF